MKRLQASPTVAVALLAVVVVCAGGAYAAGAGSSKAITACVHHRGGGLYVAKHCAKHDRRVSWSITGPQGAPGPQGATGSQGSPGSPGAAGAPGTPATTLFAQVKSDGTVNASGAPITSDHFSTGAYLLNFGRDISHCAVVANQGGVPVFTVSGASTPAAEGNGVRVDVSSPGATIRTGFPTGNTAQIETFNGTAAADSSFYIAVLC